MSSDDLNYRTPYADDAVHINPKTSPEDVHEFVERRTLNPLEVDGALVWNFSTHEVNDNALEIAVEQFGEDRFAIPYQLNQTWAYIQSVLPEEVRSAEMLRYDASRGYYDVYRNFYQETSEAGREEVKAALSEKADRW